MRLKLFTNTLSRPQIITAGNILFCTVALAATIWTLNDLAEDGENPSFILESLNEQMNYSDEYDRTYELLSGLDS